MSDAFSIEGVSFLYNTKIIEEEMQIEKGYAKKKLQPTITPWSIASKFFFMQETEKVGETHNHCVINSANQSQAIKPSVHNNEGEIQFWKRLIANIKFKKIWLVQEKLHS